MYKEGLLQDDDIYADLGEIVTGRKEGRSNQNEFIYFNSVGLQLLTSTSLMRSIRWCPKHV